MRDLTPFTDEVIHAKIDLLLPEWTFVNDRLKRIHECISFLEAINFINAIAQVAEQQKHHRLTMLQYIYLSSLMMLPVSPKKILISLKKSIPYLKNKLWNGI
jgi:hypothetical protein